MVSVVIPKYKDHLEKQISALEYQLKQDTREKDRQIHQAALKELKTVLLLTENVKGFNRLTEKQQRQLVMTYHRHQSGVGNDYKKGWTPISETVVDLDAFRQKKKPAFKRTNKNLSNQV